MKSKWIFSASGTSEIHRFIVSNLNYFYGLHYSTFLKSWSLATIMYHMSVVSIDVQLWNNRADYSRHWRDTNLSEAIVTFKVCLTWPATLRLASKYSNRKGNFLLLSWVSTSFHGHKWPLTKCKKAKGWAFQMIYEFDLSQSPFKRNVTVPTKADYTIYQETRLVVLHFVKRSLVPESTAGE